MPREEKGSPMGYDNAPSGGSSDNSSLAARRARLRGSLARVSDPPSDYQSEMPTEEASQTNPVIEETDTFDLPGSGSAPAPDPTPAPHISAAVSRSSKAAANQAAIAAQAPAEQPQPPAPTPAPAPAPTPALTPAPTPKSAPSPAASNPGPISVFEQPLPVVPESAIELISNIDQSLYACATNLAALQKLSIEQTDVLKGLTTTLQNQTLFEIGLNLNSLTESLSAALEPMKAIGELVPAMDQLVSTLEGKEATDAVEKLSPDQLVTSLADQLSAGLIDPWTFKCAYMAVYPADHPADLLHRLVELLGTQRLAGDLFRAAYEAVQAAEPPPRPVSFSAPPGERPAGYDDEIRQQLEQLRRANDEMQKRQEEKEKELRSTLDAKEKELQAAQDQINSRYDEFNSRYDELADDLNKREEQYRSIIENKEMEIVEKESEINLLRAQIEELRSQTQETMMELQKQVVDMKAAQDAAAAAAVQRANSGSFFDPSPRNNSLFDQQPQQVQQQPAQNVSQPMPVMQPSQNISQPMPVMQPSQTTSQSMPVVQPPSPNPVPQPPSPAQPPAQPPQQVAAPRPMVQPSPTTPFSGGNTGSYGSGVRAQVFEVIVRQALAGAPWREICAGPMQVNNISPEEVEAEVKRRQALLNK